MFARDSHGHERSGREGTLILQHCRAQAFHSQHRVGVSQSCNANLQTALRRLETPELRQPWVADLDSRPVERSARALTEGAVKIHIAAILRALLARNRTEAVVRSRELGLGEPR
jgi:hypothetical protein